MGVMRRGNRLSVQPVTAAEFAMVLTLAGLEDAFTVTADVREPQ
jgi:predicted RNA-binding protein with PUA-like domain